MLETGTAAPDFELSDLDGKSWRLKDSLARGPVLLAFFKTSCPPASSRFRFCRVWPTAKAPGPDRPHLVAITQDDAASTRRFEEKFGVSYQRWSTSRALIQPAARTASRTCRRCF